VTGADPSADLPTLGGDPSTVADHSGALVPYVYDLTGPAEPSVAVAVGAVGAVVSLYVAYRLLRAHSLWRRPRADRPAVPRGERSAAWFGAACGLVGLTAGLPLVGGLFGLGRMSIAVLVAAGGLLAGATFLPALLLMPGSSTSLAVRVRRALDGVIVGLCLMFCAWTVVIDPYGGFSGVAFWVVLFHCGVLSTAVIAGIRPRRGRRGAMLCAGGVGAATVGLIALAAAFAQHPAPAALVPVGIALMAAPVLVWQGTDALARIGHVSLTRASFVAVPLAMAPAVALHRLVTGANFARAEMMLGTLAAFAVVIRHFLAAVYPPPAPVRPGGGCPGEPTSGDDPVGACPAPRLHLATRIDPLTGLASRHHLRMAVAAARAIPRSTGSLLVIGIAGLEPMTCAGREEVLREVARRLQAATRPARQPAVATVPDLVARLSDTTFGVLTGTNVLRAYGLADRLLSLVTAPASVDGETVGLSACVGLTHVDAAPSAEDVLRRGEVALRRARQLGPGRVEWFDASVEEAMQRQQVVERDLPDALRRGQLDLIYQPIMDLVRGRPLAVEALLRWRHPCLGTLLPADVIPVAEETGMIGEVGDWVLRQASAQLNSWRRAGRDLSMSVNISPRQLDSAELPAALPSLLATHDLPPDRLVLELAESRIGDGAAVAEHVGALRSLGVRTALDEFGAGTASLAHMRGLPIDMVKIGKSYFDEASTGGSAPARGLPALPLIDVLVGVGRRLGVDVVAQGLEAPEQLALVRTAGCRIGQGHLFARPLPAEHTEAYLDGFPGRS
jgi:EAL domain-containing protein (putative c-di-GMP-specific phosphodiesterase class I)/GGDEF domain-containing protein